MKRWADSLGQVLRRRPSLGGGHGNPPSSPPLPSMRPPALGLQHLFPVRVENELYGSYFCLGRSLTSHGISVETPDLLPMGTEVRVRFLAGDRRMVRGGVVRTHFYLNHVDARGLAALSGMGIQFTGPAELCSDPDAEPDVPSETIQ